MKKLLLISALALCAGSAMAQTPLILASKGDAGSWSYGFDEAIVPNASMIATDNWGKLNIANGITDIKTIVVDVAAISGDWKLCEYNDENAKEYSDLLTVGKNTITFKDPAREAILAAVNKGNTITLNSVTIDDVQTTYKTLYNIGFYNMDLTVNGNTYPSKYLGGANALGDRDAVITIELGSEVEEGNFKLTVTYTDGKDEKFWDITGTGGSFEVGNNINQARIMGNNLENGVFISVKSVTISHSTALSPITSDAEVVNTTYYNLTGVKSTTPQKGLNIVVRTLNDGSKVTEKLLVK